MNNIYSHLEKQTARKFMYIIYNDMQRRTEKKTLMTDMTSLSSR